MPCLRMRATTLIRLLMYKSGTNGTAISNARIALSRLFNAAHQLGVLHHGLPCSMVSLPRLSSPERVTSLRFEAAPGAAQPQRRTYGLTCSGAQTLVSYDGEKGSGVLRLPIDATSHLARSAAKNLDAPCPGLSDEKTSAGCLSILLCGSAWRRLHQPLCLALHLSLTTLRAALLESVSCLAYTKACAWSRYSGRWPCATAYP